MELLTLPACQTAVVEKDSNGKEIEGFGYVAQQKGAKAILATLWSVADESTQLLMSEFYRLRKENSALTKAEAMQKAQIKLLNGKHTAEEAQTKRDVDVVKSVKKKICRNSCVMKTLRSRIRISGRRLC